MQIQDGEIFNVKYLFAPKFKDGRYLRTFNVRKTETFFIIFYETVEIGNVSFFSTWPKSQHLYLYIRLGNEF